MYTLIWKEFNFFLVDGVDFLYNEHIVLSLPFQFLQLEMSFSVLCSLASTPGVMLNSNNGSKTEASNYPEYRYPLFAMPGIQKHLL